MTDPPVTTGFSANRIPAAGGTIVRLSGTVDEKLDPSVVFANLNGVVVFDLKNVRRITSFGVRQWVKGLQGLAASAYFFVNCRPNIMAQFNMVPNFGGHGLVLSFFAPYRCPACEAETEKHIDVRTQFEPLRQGIAPPERCSKCGAAVELDDVPEVFFAYFAQSELPQLPPGVQTLVDQACGEGDSVATGPLRAIKQVDDDVTGIWLVGRLDARAPVKRALTDLEGHVVFVLSGLDGCEAAGVELLGRFTAAPGRGARFWFARVPVAAVEALQSPPASLGRPAVVSLEIQFACRRCNAAVRDEVDSADLAPFAASVRGSSPWRRCESCGGPLAPQLTESTAHALGGLRFAIAPPPVRMFLDRHRAAPHTKPPAGVRLPAAVQDTGAQRFGKYEIIRPLGAGGMAEIYLARLSGPEGFTKTLVVKKILPSLAENQEFLQMFLAEARLAARISHANAVQIFELGVEGGRYFLAMEYVPGWNLNAVLAAAKRRSMLMPIEVACRVVADVCAGLQAAHSLTDDTGAPLGVVHRDVSPHNVLVSPQGAVKITDFGVAKAADRMDQTLPGVIKGKLAYLSPEQVDGVEVDARSDLFAAGILLYECIACRRLFQREGEGETLRAILSGPIPPISKVRPGLPRALDAIVDRALQRNRQRRFQTAAQMQRALEEFLAATGRPAGAAETAAYLATVMEGASLPGAMTTTTPSPSPKQVAQKSESPTQEIAPGRNRRG